MARRRRRPPRGRIRQRRGLGWVFVALVALVLTAAMVLTPAKSWLAQRALLPGLPGDAPAAHWPRPGAEKGNVARPCGEGSAWNATEAIDEGPDELPVDLEAGATERHADAATNAARRVEGLPDLEHDDVLRAIARAHSEHMSRAAFFSHDDPDGRSPDDRVHDGHRRLVGESGENIWMCKGCWKDLAEPVAEAMVDGPKGWMNSPPHRENILRSTFTHAAVGVARHGDALWATQLFASTRGTLFAAVPQRIVPGTCLLLEVEAEPTSNVDAVGFDLVRVGSKEPVIDASPIGFMKIDAPLGTYRLRFHFPSGPRRFSIVSGPNVEIVEDQG